MRARRNPPPGAGRRSRGFTLVELMVTVTVSSIVMTLALRAWKPMSHATFELRDRARAVAELRLAVDALLADLGGAESVAVTLDGELQIFREPAVAGLAGAWDDGDLGILYSLAGEDLLRQDLALGSSVILATRLGSFAAVESAPDVDVTLSVGSKLSYREVTLRWTP
jgi:prepilin-type N-terminal cleavage/methylation domain-containing protein